MQFEPLELHVVDALGQQEVPDYFQQPAKAITEDVSVMRGPQAQKWILAVREEIESFKRLGVYEEVRKCDQSKYILHCMRENELINKEGQVLLKKASTPPAIDEKLGEEEGTIREKNDALIMCRKYIGQMMWLTTRTRPDIAACLGILASLMVRRPKEVKNHLVCLWRYLWTTKDHAMCTLPSPKAAQKIQKDECAEAFPSGAQDGPQPCQSPLTQSKPTVMHHLLQEVEGAEAASLCCWSINGPTGRHYCYGNHEDKQ